MQCSRLVYVGNQIGGVFVADEDSNLVVGYANDDVRIIFAECV